MMQKTWIDKNLENKRALDHHQRIHQAKLNQIAQDGQPIGTNAPKISKPAEARVVEAGLRKFKQEKKKAAQFQQSEKNIVISRENQILLSKLVDISNGKWSSVPQAATQSRKRVTAASQTRVYQPTSLNLGVRKRETERIERENHAFAKRLFDKKAIVAKSNLDKDYTAHLKYKRQIAKMPGGKAGKQRAQTRGAATTGMSHGQLMESGQIIDQYPREPSHYLGQPPPMMQGETEQQILAVSQTPEESVGNDQINLMAQVVPPIGHQEQEVQPIASQPAAAQEEAAKSQQQPAEEETKNQTASGEATQAATGVANNNNEQQVTK